MDEHLSVIDRALERDVEQIRRNAVGGWPEDEFAMAILAGYGLRGVPMDQTASDTWRDSALRKRIHVGSGVYVPAFHPNRLAAIDACLGDIHRARAGQPVCGDDVAGDQRRRDAWARAGAAVAVSRAR